MITDVFYCQVCVNYLANGQCLAFPKGIPNEILKGEKTHDELIKNQFGNYKFKKPNGR